MGYAKVKIALINENDNRPVFSRPLYNVSLHENVTVGTSVLTVLVSPALLQGHRALGKSMGRQPEGLVHETWAVREGGAPEPPEAVVFVY